MPQMTGDRPGVGFEPFTIVHRKGGRMRWNGGGKLAIYDYPIVKGKNRPDHPCPKPLGLMKELVTDFTDKDETVIDPFLGSGTTGVACVMTGRKFIGIEVKEEWFNLSVDRIRLAYGMPPQQDPEQISLFRVD